MVDRLRGTRCSVAPAMRYAIRPGRTKRVSARRGPSHAPDGRHRALARAGPARARDDDAARRPRGLATRASLAPCRRQFAITNVIGDTYQPLPAHWRWKRLGGIIAADHAEVPQRARCDPLREDLLPFLPGLVEVCSVLVSTYARIAPISSVGRSATPPALLRAAASWCAKRTRRSLSSATAAATSLERRPRQCPMGSLRGTVGSGHQRGQHKDPHRVSRRGTCDRGMLEWSPGRASD